MGKVGYKCEPYSGRVETLLRGRYPSGRAFFFGSGSTSWCLVGGGQRCSDITAQVVMVVVVVASYWEADP